MEKLELLFKEAKEAKTDEAKIDFIKKHSTDNRFLGFLQVAYSKTFVLPQFSEKEIDQTQKIEDAFGKNITFFEFVEKLRDYRNQSLNADALISAYINSNPDKKELVLGVLNRDLFGLSFKLCQDAVPGWIQDIKVMTTTKFREDFFKKKYRIWYSFKQIEGSSFVKIFKFGSICEVFPRSGRPFRNLDNLRKFFQLNVMADGVFDALLYFEDEKKKSSQSLYLKKTAQKEQIEDYKLRLVDYAPISTLKGYEYSFKYSKRHTFLKNIFKGLEVEQMKVCEIEQISNEDKPKAGTILIADDVHYLQKEPKHCLEN